MSILKLFKKVWTFQSIDRLRDNSELEIDSYILREEKDSNYLMVHYLLATSD